MGPRPGPVEPSANPVPGAPDPLDPSLPRSPRIAPDAGPAEPTPTDPNEPVTMREVPSPFYRAEAYPAQRPIDAGAGDASDAAVLPPEIPDAVPTDAAKTLQP